MPPRIYLSSPHLGTQEFEYVKEAFATNWIAPLGPHVDGFEGEFVSVLGGSEDQKSGNPALRPSDLPVFGTAPARLHAAALTSGTAALHLALRWLGVGPGDE